MCLLVRTTERTKWLQNNIKDGEDVSADAITITLRTHKNTLSFWKIEDYEELENIVAAIATNFTNLDAIDLIVLKYDSIESDANLSIKPTLGITAYEKYKQNHYEIYGLTYKTLGMVAKHIVNSFCEDEGNCIRYTLGDLKKILKKYIKNSEINPEDLNDSVLNKLSLNKISIIS